MNRLIPSQIKDALAFSEGIAQLIEGLPDSPEWGGGERLVLPSVLPLRVDDGYTTEPYAWLIANDFNGYDLTTTNPSKETA